MSITVDTERARAVFLEAVELVDSAAQLPPEWIQRTQEVGRCPSRTFVSMLGTALLSRATDPRVDPLVLKAGGSPAQGLESYSARTIATNVLAPMAVEHMVDIGTRGREPLNNQPFFRYTWVHREMVVKDPVRPHLDFLVETLERLRELPEEELLPALAAFLAVRRRVARRPVPRIQVVSTHWTINEFVSAVADFVTSWPEDGKRGQAMVAAALDLVYPVVRLGHVNDPSRHVPGDVKAFLEEEDVTPTASVEVKQKQVTRSDVLYWTEALSRASVARGAYVMLSPSQQDLDAEQLTAQVLTQRNVLVRLYTSAATFLHESIIWSSRGLDDFLCQFPLRMQERLEEANVSDESLQEWVDLFGS
ncbi:MAG: restriction endonuclease, SacI family [Trueperaceae bacterium]